MLVQTIKETALRSLSGRLIAGTLGLAVLVACEAPTGEMDAAKAEATSAQLEENAQSIPKVLPSGDIDVALAAFERYCVRNVKTQSRSLPLLQQDGYVQFVQNASATVYGHPEGKPFFTLGGPNPRNPAFCAIGLEGSASNKLAMAKFATGPLRMERNATLTARADTEDAFWNRERRQVAFIFNRNIEDEGDLLFFGIYEF